MKLIETDKIYLTIAFKENHELGLYLNNLQSLQIDPKWSINFIQLFDNPPDHNARIFKHYNCKKNIPFLAIDGQAVIYGSNSINTFIKRLHGIRYVDNFDELGTRDKSIITTVESPENTKTTDILNTQSNQTYQINN